MIQMPHFENPFATAYLAGMTNGKKLERDAICAELESYFELTRYSVEAEGAKQNPEWDAGFQAALALLKSSIDASEQLQNKMSPNALMNRADWLKNAEVIEISMGEQK
jgi:hypothetical protein